MGIDNWCTCGLANCCGARFSLHWTFWFNLVLQLIFAVIQYPTSWKYIVLIATVWGPACLLALAFHEWGHIGATRCQRGTYSMSMLWPLGGFNDCTVPNGSCSQEFCIALAGPTMHIPLMMLWVLVLAVCAEEGVNYYGSVVFNVDDLDQGGAGEWFSQLAKRSLDVNIMIFCLNLLLPAYPMDAASMLAAVCGHFGLSLQSTGWVLTIIGGVLGAALLIVGIIYIVGGDGPGVFLLLLGLYVLYTSWQMYGQVKAGSLGQHPIFKPDCYHKERNPPPNNTRSMAPRPQAPTQRSSRTPPASPRKGTNTKGIPQNKSSTKSAPPQPPKTGSNTNTTTAPKKTKKTPTGTSGDIETGDDGGPNSNSNNKSLPKRGNSKKGIGAGEPKKPTAGKKKKASTKTNLSQENA